MSQASAEQSGGAYRREDPIDASYRPVRNSAPSWGGVIGVAVASTILGALLGAGGAFLMNEPRVAAVEARLSDLDRIAAEESRRTKSTIAVETASLRADVNTLKEQAARGEGGFTAAMTPSAVFAVESVINQARAGQPFTQAYLALAATLPDDPNVRALAPYADIGAPTLDALKASFVDAELAANRAASTTAPTGAVAAAQSLLSRFVTVRKSDVSAMTPTEAAMSRARDRLKVDDLAGAVGDVSALTGEPAKAASAWLKQAQARLAIDDSVGALKVRLDRAREQRG